MEEDSVTAIPAGVFGITRKLLSDTRPGPLRTFGREGSITQNVPNFLDDSLGVRLGKEEAVYAVGDHVPDSPNCGSDYRDAAGHRFKNFVWRTLGDRGENQKITALHIFHHVLVRYPTSDNNAVSTAH